MSQNLLFTGENSGRLTETKLDSLYTSLHELHRLGKSLKVRMFSHDQNKKMDFSTPTWRRDVKSSKTLKRLSPGSSIVCWKVKRSVAVIVENRRNCNAGTSHFLPVCFLPIM